MTEHSSEALDTALAYYQAWTGHDFEHARRRVDLATQPLPARAARAVGAGPCVGRPPVDPAVAARPRQPGRRVHRQIAQGIFVALFILFVAQRLHGGPAEIGLLRGVQAIGATGGGLALTILSRTVSPVALTAWAAASFGLIDLVLWNAPALTTSALL